MWFFGFFLTIFLFYLSKYLYRIYPAFFTHTVLLPSVVIITLLEVGHIDYKVYYNSARYLTFFLNPATVALSYLLYKRWDSIQRYTKEVFITIIISSILGIVSAYLLIIIMGGERYTALSMVPKSVTTPIAVRVSEIVGGIPSLTAVFVVITGITGAILGPPLLRLFRIDHPLAWGLSMGITAHGIGTARAVEEGETEGAASGIGFILMGLFTALFAPVVVFLLERIL